MKFADSRTLAQAREAAARQRAERKAMGLPALSNPIEKALRHPTSLRAAITAKCCECMGGPAEPNFRKHVRECTSPRCPLFRLRPWQRSEEVTDAREA